MTIFPERLKFKPVSPFNFGSDEQKSTIWDWLDYKMSVGKINVIVIEGESQTGKSTLADHICQHYRKVYNLWYGINDVFKTLHEYETMWYSGSRAMLWNWNFFDEPQLAAPKIRWYDERVMAIQQIVGAYGMLKQNLVLALPDMDELGRGFYRNLTYRIITDVRKFHGEIKYTAYIYRPWKSMQKKMWYWTGVGIYNIPTLKLSEEYFKKKADNLFKDKLLEWEHNVLRQKQRAEFYDERYGEPTIPPPISEERKRELDARYADPKYNP